MNEDWKKVFENQPPVPYSVVSNMDDGRYDENAVLFFEETGTLGEAYRLYKINDFKDGRDTLVIPSEVNGKPVIAIGKWAGMAIRHIRNLYIPSSVKVIEKCAFGCLEAELETLVVDGVEEIGDRAFWCLHVKNIVLGEGIKEIGERTFDSAREESLVLPDSLEIIRESAFNDNVYLKTIRFGKGLKRIDSSAFCWCHRLTSLNFPNSLKSIEQDAFRSCWELQSIKFGSGLKYVSISAFENCEKLIEVDFGDAPVTVMPKAFDGCEKLRKITIGKNCEYIREDSFSDCYSLIEICNKSDFEIKRDLLPDEEKYKVDRKTLYFPFVKNVCKDESESCLKQTEDGFVFFEKDDEKILVSYEGSGGRVEIPEGTTAIWNYAFYCNHTIEEVIVPYTVKTIGQCAFNGCSLKKIQLCAWEEEGDNTFRDDSCLQTICDYAFGETRLDEIKIPDSVTHIGKGAFIHSHFLKDVVWSEGCKNVLRDTFKNNESLESVKLPNGMQFVDDYAFENCKALERITLPKSIVRVSPTAFLISKTLVLTHDGTLYNLPEIPEGIMADIASDHQY